jgi:hypothetical protein
MKYEHIVCKIVTRQYLGLKSLSEAKIFWHAIPLKLQSDWKKCFQRISKRSIKNFRSSQVLTTFMSITGTLWHATYSRKLSCIAFSRRQHQIHIVAKRDITKKIVLPEVTAIIQYKEPAFERSLTTRIRLKSS